MNIVNDHDVLVAKARDLWEKDGNQYLGMNMDWDYNGHKVHVSMLNYIPKALTHFQH